MYKFAGETGMSLFLKKRKCYASSDPAPIHGRNDDSQPSHRREWMHADEALEGALYVDGHVNLYYGRQTQMPKRFVSRMRLCLSGSTDYWVNDRLGQPFFVIHKTVNEGMLKVLREDIIPRLNREVPGQPGAQELETNPRQHRYMPVFDREGYSVDFFDELVRERIAFTSRIVNPDYGALDQEHKKLSAQLSKRKEQYADISLHNKELSGKEVKRYIQKKIDREQEIKDMEEKRKEIVEKKKDTPQKVQFKDLEEEQRFDTSLNKRKFFLYLIKIIAYRAETTLVNLIKKQMACPQQARPLIRKLYTGDADIQVNNDRHILPVKIHRTNHWADDKILENLCQQLTKHKPFSPPPI